jgi:hypothetical protein
MQGIHLLTFIYPRVALIIAIASLGAVVMLPETLASKLLRDKAARMNKQAGRRKYIAPADLGRGSFWSSMVCVFPNLHVTIMR